MHRPRPRAEIRLHLIGQSVGEIDGLQQVLRLTAAIEGVDRGVAVIGLLLDPGGKRRPTGNAVEQSTADIGSYLTQRNRSTYSSVPSSVLKNRYGSKLEPTLPMKRPV